MFSRSKFVVMSLLVVFVLVGVADAFPVSSFADFCATSVDFYLRRQSVCSASNAADQTVDNLMFRDPMTNIEGRVLGDWHMGFIDYMSAGAMVLGHADNLSMNDYPGYEGYMSGAYFGTIQNDGQRPDDIWVIHDVWENGLGSIENGAWTLGDDDLLFTSQDILFGPDEIRGDVSWLPVFTFGQNAPAILPSMTITPEEGDWPGDEIPAAVPEPATLTLFGLGVVGLGIVRRKRKSYLG